MCCLEEVYGCLQCGMFSVVNVYLDHLKFCIVCINGRRCVCCGECNVVSNECNETTSCLVQPIGTHGGEVMYFGRVCFRGELGFLNCDDICMCVVNKQFELLEFVFASVYVDLQYDEISLTFTAGSVSLCRGALCGCGGYYDCDACTIVCMLRECEAAMVTAILVWGGGECMRCGCGECRECWWYTWFRYCI